MVGTGNQIDPGGRRLRASLGGVPQGPAAGNSVVTRDVRGTPSARPGVEGGNQARRVGMDVLTLSTPDQRGEPRAAYGGGWADGKLTVRERGIQGNRGTTRTSGEHPDPYPGIPNPEADGPATPAYLMDNRTLSWQIGTDKTTQEDNDGPFAVTQAYNGRRFPLGNQGDPWTQIMGPSLGLYRDYGTRGVGGVHGPAPAMFALPGDGSGAHVGTMLSPGDPEDGIQKIRGGPPHGLHSPTIPSLKTTMARQASIPQQKQGRADRPNNSQIAGQSYSQTVLHEGGSGASQMPRMPSPGRAAGIMSRFVRRS